MHKKKIEAGNTNFPSLKSLGHYGNDKRARDFYYS